MLIRGEHIIYRNSYGQEVRFPRSRTALKRLNRRSVEAVIPEVKEIFQRLQKRPGFKATVVCADDIGLELNVAFPTINRAFKQLCEDGTASRISARRFRIQNEVQNGKEVKA